MFGLFEISLLKNTVYGHSETQLQPSTQQQTINLGSAQHTARTDPGLSPATKQLIGAQPNIQQGLINLHIQSLRLRL